MADLNLAYLEEGAAFRSDELYFIRLAGGYIRSIFWHVFSGHNKKNRQDLYKAVTDLKVPSENAEGHRIFCASIIPDAKHLRNGDTDCLSGQFKAVLKNLPENFDQIFEDKLKQDFGIFLRFRDDKGNKNTLTFIKTIEVLQHRRNYLEHYSKLDEKGKFKTRETYNKRQKDGDPIYSDLWFIESLGLFLLPQILHSFAGRVASSEVKRQRTSIMAAAIHEQVKVIVKERKQNTRNAFAEERSRKSIKDKSARKKKLDPDLPWRVAHRQMSLAPTTDYREHEFKLRYYFIGENRIGVLRKIFRKDGDTRPVHFRRDIEPFYSLTVNVGLLIHRLFEEIKEKDESLLKDDEKLRLIRDTIAHGNFFWDAKQKTETDTEPLGIRKIFETIGRTAWKTRGSGRAEELFGQIENLLRHENFSVVDISGQPPKYLHITKWGPKYRKEYLETKQEGVLLDKRKDFRKEVARWMRGLIAARKVIRKEVYLEKRAKK
jgi:hypothetical protein